MAFENADGLEHLRLGPAQIAFGGSRARHDHFGFRVEIRRLDELAAFATELRDLAARAIASNAFYEPAFMAASAPAFGRDVLAGLVWRRAAPARLIGFFPVAIERRRYGLSIPMLVGGRIRMVRSARR